jgi:ribosomal protein S18 acetylase RimI-like enzyme
MTENVAMLRAARRDDLPAVHELERAAGAAFRDLDMAAVADDEPLSITELASFQQDGRAWVITDDADRPVAYLLLNVVDENAHVEQVSVHPDHARQGLGKTLLDTAAAWAEAHGLAAVTLSTYANVPWNAPYYQRLGFHIMPEDQITRGSAASANTSTLAASPGGPASPCDAPSAATPPALRPPPRERCTPDYPVSASHLFEGDGNGRRGLRKETVRETGCGIMAEHHPIYRTQRGPDAITQWCRTKPAI